jgi:hypothetical protein
MPVSDISKAIGSGSLVCVLQWSDMERDVALVGELERVREQIVDDLLQSQGVRPHRKGKVVLQFDLEIDVLLLRDFAEGAIRLIREDRKGEIADVERHRA